MSKLGVNIDHVATLREARKGRKPDPVTAAMICERGGCDSVVCHLREDRRHIKDADLRRLKEVVRTRLNLEMSVARDIVTIACKVRPDQATLVPERRQEITTEGGLDVLGGEKRIRAVVERLSSCGIEVSLFIDPRHDQIDASRRVGAKTIELHTGEYSNTRTPSGARRRLKELESAVRYARSHGMVVNAGHGLTYENVKAVAALDGVNELNIGHSIISWAIFVGLESAVREMVRIIR